MKKITDFNTALMTNRPVFNPDLIKAGNVIEIYSIDASATDSTLLPYRTGIIEKVDATMIKYMFFSPLVEGGKMTYGFLYPDDILLNFATDSQWEGKDTLFIFEV